MEAFSFLARSRTTYFVSIDINGRIILANDLLQEAIPTFGKGAAGLQVTQMVLPADHAGFIQAIELCYSAKKTAPFTAHFRLHTREAQLWTAWEFTWIAGNGTIPPHITGIGHVMHQKYHCLFEQASDPILITDFTGRFIDANAAMLNLFGYTKEELLTLDISSLIDKEELKAKPIRFDLLAAGEHIFTHRMMVHKNGTIIYVEANVKKFGEDMVMAIARDITRRKITEETLERSEKNLRHVLSSSTENFYLINTQYRVELINVAAERNLLKAWGRTVVLGANILDLIPPDNDEPAKESIDKALAGEYAEYELYTTALDNRPGWFLVSFIPVTNDDGTITGVYVVTRNITERKETEKEKDEILYKLNQRVKELKKSEANLNTVFNSTDSVYVLMDTKFQILSYNKPALEFAARELKHTIRSSDSFLDCFPHERQSLLLSHLKKALSGAYVNYETIYPQPNGTNNWYDVRIFAISEKNGETFGIMMAALDITEKKLLEQEILDQKVQEQKRITRAMIKAQEKERNHIGQELHDNVNQILAGTKIYLTRAAEKDEKIRGLVQYPLELIDSSINEIRQLSGRQVTPLKNIDLKELVSSLLDNLMNQSNVKAVLNYTLPVALIDDDLNLNIYRIIQEQVTNILKHADAENVWVSIETDKDRPAIHIRITDDGKGFDPGKKRNGIGISNMISRIESFNGEVAIESSPGKGCSVKIRIPYFS